MKKLLLSIMVTCSLGMGMADAQIREVPEAAEEFLQEKYPDLSGVEWVDNLTNFTAIFTSNQKLLKTRFNNKGTWLQTEVTLDEKEVPEAVKDGLSKSRYADREVQQWASFESAKTKGLQYRLLVANSKVEKKYLFFTEEGRLVKEAITL